MLEHLDPQIVAPAHQLADVPSAIARIARAGDISPQDARDALDKAAELDQEHVTPTAVHLRRALELQANIRVLDGPYVALAEERRCARLTTDEHLAAANPPCEVLLVGETTP